MYTNIVSKCTYLHGRSWLFTLFHYLTGSIRILIKIHFIFQIYSYRHVLNKFSNDSLFCAHIMYMYIIYMIYYTDMCTSHLIPEQLLSLWMWESRLWFGRLLLFPNCPAWKPFTAASVRSASLWAWSLWLPRSRPTGHVWLAFPDRGPAFANIVQSECSICSRTVRGPDWEILIDKGRHGMPASALMHYYLFYFYSLFCLYFRLFANVKTFHVSTHPGMMLLVPPDSEDQYLDPCIWI